MLPIPCPQPLRPTNRTCSTPTAPSHSPSWDPSGAANGRSFKLAELYRLLDCDLVDVVRLTDELILIVDDEGKFKSPAYLNLLATYLWHQHQPAARGVDAIVGRAILCHDKQFR